MRTFLIITMSILCMSIYSQDKENCVITGKVVDINKKPIENATVELTTEIGVVTEKTNSNGEYCIKNIGDGNFDLLIFHPHKGSVRFEGGNGIVVENGHLIMSTVELSDVTQAENKEYEKLINKADEMFNAKNYEKALELYKRAFTFKPTDQYPADKIEEIKKILK